MDKHVKVVLPHSWYNCPTWWRHMVIHLFDKHEYNMSWDQCKTDEIIDDYLHEKYGAQYVSKSHVIFPSESDYCACVLEWS
jgi:hypothetical protein